MKTKAKAKAYNTCIYRLTPNTAAAGALFVSQTERAYNLQSVG